MPIHAEDLRRYLAESTGRPVSLRMNNNTHSMINARPDPPGIRVSLHRMFLDADEKVLKALAKFIISPTPAVRRIIREYINGYQLDAAGGQQPTRPVRVVRGTAKGAVYNLEERAAALNEAFFGGELSFRIIWGKPARGGHRQRGVTLGTWNDRQRIIRIHPMLDHSGVPSYFLDYIIFHEMVHIIVPMQLGDSGRRHIHTDDFYRLERQFPNYAEAVAWEKRWIGKLLRAWNGHGDHPGRANDYNRG